MIVQRIAPRAPDLSSEPRAQPAQPEYSQIKSSVYLVRQDNTYLQVPTMFARHAVNTATHAKTFQALHCQISINLSGNFRIYLAFVNVI